MKFRYVSAGLVSAEKNVPKSLQHRRGKAGWSETPKNRDTVRSPFSTIRLLS